MYRPLPHITNTKMQKGELCMEKQQLFVQAMLRLSFGVNSKVSLTNCLNIGKPTS